jgi:hypothetical protein
VSYRDTRLWKVFEASQKLHPEAQNLVAGFERSRESAAIIAAEIGRDMPTYTQHDITHIDALWEYADLICGPNYDLNPVEIYVLGISFLVHDLANGTAAIPGGISSITNGSRWDDLLAMEYYSEFGKYPEGKNGIPDEVHKKAIARYLRETHAEIAAQLPQAEYRDGSGGSSYYLIDDVDLRSKYGYLAGKIAASHWWSTKSLRSKFEVEIGPRAKMPDSWVVDPLILACILRCADACHLDSRRAPALLRIIRDIHDESLEHWIFQDKLQKPQVKDDRIVYTSATPFTLDESDAWWLCYETLSSVNNELTSVDSILADLGKPRLSARSVAGIKDLDTLGQMIPTVNWYPIDAQVRVSDVVNLVRRLGGAELYGDDPRIALRELISNAADAVRAKKCMLEMQGAKPWEISSDVTVSMVTDDGETWLGVKDTGIGMSKEVMSGPLLNFGTSYWGSSESRRDLPGLLSSGFRPTGQYGLGFFSIFMLGESVKVISRRYDAALQDTMVLEFKHGLDGRPLLRPAEPREQLINGGTEVQVRLQEGTGERLLDLQSYDDSEQDTYSINQVCAWLCPALDVDLYASHGAARELAVRANDWKEISSGDLIRRIYIGFPTQALQESIEAMAGPLADLSCQGTLYGRIALSPTLVVFESDPESDQPRHSTSRNLSAPVVVGGVRTETTLRRATGLVVGKSVKAARDVALPVIGAKDFGEWASTQVLTITADERVIQGRSWEDAIKAACALFGSIDGHSICESMIGSLDYRGIVEYVADLSEVILLQDAAWSNHHRRIPASLLAANVLTVDTGRSISLSAGRDIFGTHREVWDWTLKDSIYGVNGINTIRGTALRAIAESWGVSDWEIFSQITPGEGEQILEVGSANGKPIKLRSHRIFKPSEL